MGKKHPLPEYETDDIVELIRQRVHSFRDRKILLRRLVDGIVIEKLAEEFELSPRQIKNILYKNEEILFRKLH